MPEDKQKDDHWDRYADVRAELEKRPPFNEMLGTREEHNEFSHNERIEELEGDVKLLKRHKHDEHTGDVMARI